jgi:hypothetical protein
MIAQFERKQSRTWIALLTTIILAMVALTDSAVGQQRDAYQQRRRGTPDGTGAPAGVAQPGNYGGLPQQAGDIATGARFANGEQDKNAEAANEKTRTALRKTLPEVKFENVVLADAIAFIRDVTELNIYVDWKAAEAAGIARDMPISLRLRGVPAGEVLRLMLRETSPDMRYRIESGIVVISPVVPQPVALIKAYNVEDLTRQIDAQMLKSIELLEQRAKNAPDDTQREQFDRQIVNLQNVEKENRNYRMQELVTLIQSTVAPFVLAGMSVRSFDNKLIITTDEAGHQEVTKVLDMLRDRGEGAGEGRKPAPKAGAGSVP